MARWNPVVFTRCDCQPGACPAAVRFEPFGRTRAATHVVVHQPVRVAAGYRGSRHGREAGRPAASLALPFVLLGAAALLLASLDSSRS
jgi:hypothetical protein